MGIHLGRRERGTPTEREGIISGSRDDVNEIALINLGLRERQRGREKQSAFRLLIWKGNIL